MISSVNDADVTSNVTSGAGSLIATNPVSPAEAFLYRPVTSGMHYARVTGTGTLSNVDYTLSISSCGSPS